MRGDDAIRSRAELSGLTPLLAFSSFVFSINYKNGIHRECRNECRRDFSLALVAGCSGDDAVAKPEGDLVGAYRAVFREANPYDDHRIGRDGGEIAARRFAASGPIDGPPILVIHGYPESQHLYDRVIPLLRPTRDVISFDFLGWGDSDKPDADSHCYDAASLKTDMEAVIAYFALKQLVVVVHDASGWPGIDWALDNPEQTAALVLLNTVYHPSAGATPPEGLAQFAASGPAAPSATFWWQRP